MKKPDEIELQSPDEELAKKRYLKRAMRSVQKNWNMLSRINPDKCGQPSYLAICSEAIKINEAALKHVTADKLNHTDYQILCEAAVQINGDALQFVNANRLDKAAYLRICKVAIKKNEYSLRHVNEKRLKKIGYKAICINAVKEEGNVLQFVKESKLKTEDFLTICIESFKQNLDALKHIPHDKLGTEAYQKICTESIKKSWKALEYLEIEPLDPKVYQTICTDAVKQNGLAFKYIDKKKLTPSIVHRLYTLAVKQNGLALKYVEEKQLDPLLYQTLCTVAVQQNGLALKYMDEKKLDPTLYKTLCASAVKQNGLALKYMDEKKLDPSLYQTLCTSAVNQNGLALKYVDEKKLDPTFYQTLCTSAVNQNGLALRFVNEKQLDAALYSFFCTKAVNQNGLALEHVKSDKLSKEDYKTICMNAIEQNESALKYIPLEWLLGDPALLTYAIRISPIMLTKITITTANKHNIIDSILKIGIDHILYHDARLIPILRSLMVGNSAQLNKITDCIAQIDGIVVTDERFVNYEVADTYDVYAEKKKEKGKTFIHVDKNDLLWFLKELNPYPRASDIKKISMVLLGHSPNKPSRLAGLSMDETARIVEDNAIIEGVLLLGCHTAQSKPLEEEAKMIEKFRAKESEQKTCFFFLACQEPLSTDTLKFPKGYHEGYILNKKNATSYELVYLVGKEIKQRGELNATQLAHVTRIMKPGGKLNFPKKVGQLNTLSTIVDQLRKEELEGIVGESAFAISDYKASKAYLPYLTTITLKPAEEDKLQASSMKELVRALEKTITDPKRHLWVKGYTKAVHVDTKEKKLHGSRDHLYKKEYDTEFYKSQKDTINRHSLFAARRKEKAAMTGEPGEETLAKAVKIEVIRKF